MNNCGENSFWGTSSHKNTENNLQVKFVEFATPQTAKEQTVAKFLQLFCFGRGIRQPNV